jgi:hypothetical protein
MLPGVGMIIGCEVREAMVPERDILDDLPLENLSRRIRSGDRCLLLGDSELMEREKRYPKGTSVEGHSHTEILPCLVV